MAALRIRWFASLVETTGVAEETLEVAPGQTVADAWRILGERHPALATVGFRPLAACDRGYARWDASLEGVAELAFLPPVSGG